MVKIDSASKMLTSAQLKDYVQQLRATTCVDFVLTTGVYDLLHDGHVNYLEDASHLGLVLIVGIDSDARVQKDKGPTRPILPEQIRARVVSGLAAVDRVTIFDDFEELVSVVQPHVIVASPTYKQDPDLKRFDHARSLGAEIRIVPSRSTIHTTDVIGKILSCRQAS